MGVLDGYTPVLVLPQPYPTPLHAKLLDPAMLAARQRIVDLWDAECCKGYVYGCSSLNCMDVFTEYVHVRKFSVDGIKMIDGMLEYTVAFNHWKCVGKYVMWYIAQRLSSRCTRMPASTMLYSLLLVTS